MESHHPENDQLSQDCSQPEVLSQDLAQPHNKTSEVEDGQDQDVPQPRGFLQYLLSNLEDDIYRLIGFEPSAVAASAAAIELRSSARSGAGVLSQPTNTQVRIF
jgi:hypothetical protein